MGARGKEMPRHPPALREGFTLIELLTVIAIIAILTAIAAANLLEAQTRAKVSRAKADLRTLTLAVEVYRVDHNAYPLVADEKGEAIAPYPPIGLGPEAFETRLSPSVTTPVPYITSLPADPFAARGPDEEDPRIFEGQGYHCGTADYALANDGSEGAAKLRVFLRMMGDESGATQHFMSSHGPDLDHDGR